jgi:hypothetical protein
MSNQLNNENGMDNYRTVSERISIFREKYSPADGWGIETEASPLNEQRTCFKAVSKVTFNGKIISMGSAERVWTHECPFPLEYAETASVGRALAFLGIGADALEEPDSGRIPPSEKNKKDNISNMKDYQKNKPEEKEIIIPSEIKKIFDFLGINPPNLKYNYDKEKNLLFVVNEPGECLRFRKELMGYGFEIDKTSQKFMLDLTKIKKNIKNQTKKA